MRNNAWLLELADAKLIMANMCSSVCMSESCLKPERSAAAEASGASSEELHSYPAKGRATRSLRANGAGWILAIHGSSSFNIQQFLPLPAFYQDRWFAWLIVIAAAIGIWVLIRFRELRAANAAEARMKDRLMERDRIARELHDSLLQGFQSVIFRIHTVWKATPHDQQASATRSSASWMNFVNL